MRTVTSLYITLFCLNPMPAFAADSYRAGYALTLTVGEDVFQIQTQSSLSKAAPIQHDLGKYRVLMILTETSESEYSMHIVVEESGVDSMQRDTLEHSITGSFSGIIEFSAEKGSANIEGAIAVNPLRDQSVEHGGASLHRTQRVEKQSFQQGAGLATKTPIAAR